MIAAARPPTGNAGVGAWHRQCRGIQNILKCIQTNLKCIQTLKEKFQCNVGYSGHESMGYLICVSAVLLGASSIERHITLDRSMYGSDQSAS